MYFGYESMYRRYVNLNASAAFDSVSDEGEKSIYLSRHTSTHTLAAVLVSCLMCAAEDGEKARSNPTLPWNGKISALARILN